MKNHAEVSKVRHSQIAAAFRIGRNAVKLSRPQYEFQAVNPFSERGGNMPASLASVQAAKWYAFRAGVSREMGNISEAGAWLRNARWAMRRATELGKA